MGRYIYTRAGSFKSLALQPQLPCEAEPTFTLANVRSIRFRPFLAHENANSLDEGRGALRLPRSNPEIWFLVYFVSCEMETAPGPLQSPNAGASAY
jgi:hypothetical protein